MQSFVMFFALSGCPAFPIFFKNFPVFKRFTATSFVYALSRAIVYILTSFGLVYLTKYFDEYGIVFATVPVLIAFWWGLSHFEKLEKKAGVHPKSSCIASHSLVADAH